MSDTTLVGKPLPTGWTMTTKIANEAGKVWNGSAWVTYDVADWLDYAISTPETPAGSGIYVCQFPTSAPAGYYTWEGSKHVSETGAATDPVMFASAAPTYWNGTTFGVVPEVGAVVVAANQILSQPLGTDRVYTFTLRDESGDVVTTYSGTEILACKIWSGQSQAESATPAAAWLEPLDGTLNVTVAASDIADLDAGLYRMVGTLTTGGVTVDFFDGSLDLTPSPGATSAPATYCTYEDMQLYAPQVKMLHDDRVNLAGFLAERGRARTWTNERCLDGYRPNYGRARRYVGPDGSTAGSFLRWVTSGPNGEATPTLDSLSAAIDLGGLNITAKIREANAHMAIAIVYMNQPGNGNPYHQLGAEHQARAMTLLQSAVIEIDTDSPLDGVPNVRVGQDCTWLS